MTAATQAGALSRVALIWPAIDWHAAHRIVRRLQARIVKATQESRWGKVRALQHLLTHSLSGKLLAVKQVTENSGKRTPECGHKITRTTGWRCHKVVWRVFGGSDSMSNRLLLHPRCHTRVHDRELKVEKPRLLKEALSEA
jgi:hypothetical protein